MSEFQDKVILISGGGTGIGRATTEAFVRQGASAFIVGRRREPLVEVASAHEGRVRWLDTDITQPGAPKAAVEATLEAFGQLDVLVNNAGTLSMSPLDETPDEEIARVFRVNVFGTLALTREALPALRERQGAIVNVSTSLTRGVMPTTAAYAGSKAAIDHITRVLAAELGPAGVRVNAVAPGLTVTDMSAGFRAQDALVKGITAQTPMGRLGEPAEVADAIVLAASDRARWVTGQVIQAAGGLML